MNQPPDETRDTAPPSPAPEHGVPDSPDAGVVPSSSNLQETPPPQANSQTYDPWEITTRQREKLSALAQAVRETLSGTTPNPDKETKKRLPRAEPTPAADAMLPTPTPQELVAARATDPMRSADIPTLDDGQDKPPAETLIQSSPQPVTPVTNNHDDESWDSDFDEPDQFRPAAAHPGLAQSPVAETLDYPSDRPLGDNASDHPSLDPHSDSDPSPDRSQTTGGNFASFPAGPAAIRPNSRDEISELDRTVAVDGPPPVDALAATVECGAEERIPTNDLPTFDVTAITPGPPPPPGETKTQVGAMAQKKRSPGPGDHLQYFGDYELLSELARGGMGVVYRARQRTLGRMVALKMILAGSLATDYAIKRFLIEAEAAARLDHPNIVPIYEIGEHEGLHYFSMKFVEGVSLAAITRQLVSDPRRTARIMATVARAVGHAHKRGILHRDLKPSNILIDKAGEPHVTDFGLAKIVAEGREGDGLTMEGSVMGTPSYMAPEQAEGKSATLTTAADIWGLGAILYDCLTAVPPFKGDTALATVAMVRSLEPRHPGEINPDVPADLATICIKCLQKEPNKRYPTAEALAQDLENWLEGKPISARPIGRVERTIMWARRRPALAGLAAAVVISVILGLAGILWQWSEAVTARRAEAAARQVAENRAVKLQEQALRIRLQLNRAELLRGRMLMQAGDADRAEGVLWATALGSPWAAERFENPAMPLTAGPFTPAEWALWDLYRQRPREGALPGLRAMALAASPDTTLVAAVSGNRLTVKNRVTNRILLEATTTATLLSTPVISSDGKRVAAADYLAGIAYVWDLNPDATETEHPGKPLRIFNPPTAVEPVRDPSTGLMTPNSLAETGAAAVLRTNPRIQFMDSDRLLLWNRSSMELRRISTGDLIAKGPGVPDNATPETDVELTLLPPPGEAPADHVALAAYGMELRPIRQLTGASAGILEWGLPLPTGDDPRSRGRRPMRLAQAGLDMAIAFQTPAGALVAAASDGTTIVQVQRLSRDEVPRLDHLSLSPDSSTLVGLSARSLYVWSFPDLRLQAVSAVLGGGIPTGVVALSGGEQCLVGEWDQTVAFYSTRSAQPEWLRRQPSVIGGQIFDVGTTGPVALVSTGDGRSPVQLWTADRPREIARANPREPGFDMALRLTEDGTSLALLTALSVGPAVEIIPFATPNAEPYLVRLELPTVEVAMNLGISASGHVIAAVTSGHLVVLDSNGDGFRQRLYPIPTIPTDVAVTDCGTTIAVLMKGRVLLLGRETGTTHTIELAPGQSVYNSTFSDNGQILSAPTGDDVLLISVPEARVIGSLVPGTGGRIVASAISPKGGLAATVSREGRLGLWDVNTREELASIDLDAGALMQVRFMPGGTRLRWWGEKASGIYDLEVGFERLAKNLGDRLPIALPTVVAQAGTSEILRLLRALRPYAPSAVAEAESTLTANAKTSRD